MDNVHEMVGFDFSRNTIYFALKGTLSNSFTFPQNIFFLAIWQIID